MRKIRFYGRMILDFQILTVYRDLHRLLPSFTGAVLDVGCGQSPYRHLLRHTQTTYYGIDIVDAEKFDYKNPEVTPFNGEDIPFPDEKFDALICTEVLEHVENYQKLVNEIFRVMKKGGTGVVTIPWSARYHYIPFDYFRYTPSALKSIFRRFSEVSIRPRGSDTIAIVSKIIVLWFRNLIPKRPWDWFLLPVWIALLPVLGLLVFVAHVILWLGWGSDDDPLGYTIVVKK